MAILPWAKKMQVEVEHLPETLAALRESSVHIRQVSEDLAEVAASLRRVTDALDAAGLAEATELVKRSAQINEAVLGNLAKLPGADLLNPFRRPR